MASLYGPILTGVGLLQDGKLPKSAKDKYLIEVSSLLLTGNEGGHGGSPTTKIFSSLFPLPPVAGPLITNVTTLSTENAFWFKPDPFATLIATQLNDPNNNPMWHIIFEDILLEKTAVALDINGSTPLAPAVFDASFLVPNISFPPTPPDLAIGLNITPPELAAKLIELGISLQIPSIPSPPNIKFPDINLPIPPLVLVDLCIGLIKLPFDLLLKLVLPPAIDIVLNLSGLPKLVFDLAFDIVLQLLIDLGLLLIVPKLFIASLLIWLKDVVAMICVDIVGLIVGAGGGMTKSVAVLTGLV
jgi:hypothetical protein